MSIASFTESKRLSLSLPIRISTGLVSAAIVPLLITFLFISLQTIPALIDQANKAMTNDASARVQLIDTYLSERVLDVRTVQNTGSQIPSVQALLTQDVPGTPAFLRDAAGGGYIMLLAGYVRDKNYANWALLSTSGQMMLYYPPQNQPQPHGKTMVPPEELQAVDAGQTFISPVYYSPDSGKAYVDIYAPLTAAQQTLPGSQSSIPSGASLPSGTGAQSLSQPPANAPLIGIVRATLTLDYIYNVVQKDLNSNGSGSFAFITDENGVRVADSDAQRRFTSVATLPPNVEQLIGQEKRYGSASPVPVLHDSAVAASLKRPAQSDTFQTQPAGKTTPFQIVRQKIGAVPWNYFVLSPLDTETAVARQQQTYIAIVALLTACLIAIIGLVAGRNISRPVLRAVEYLRGNSRTLNSLVSLQENTASQQVWVVDSSQTGLHSIQYYTQATMVASNTLKQKIGTLLRYLPQSDNQDILQEVTELLYIVNYIENASTYQDVSNQKLATALKLATQVTEQIHGGATSAKQAAGQLEVIVKDLRSVVGR